MGPILAVLLALQTVPSEKVAQKAALYLKSQSAELRKDPEFSLWTLVVLQVPRTDPVVLDLLQIVMTRPPETTRSAALQAMILCDLDPPRYRDRIAHCAQFLVDNQCDDGRWDQGRAVDAPALPALPEPPPRKFRDFDPMPVRKVQKVQITRQRPGAKAGDSVLSRWAAWGLVVCEQAGVVLPKELPIRAAASWRIGEHDPADLVSALSIHVYLQGKDWRKDPDVLKALDRLAVRDLPSDPQSLLVLKRALTHYGADTLGKRNWWQEGAAALAAAQSPDGGWGSVEDTCHAAMFVHLPRHHYGPFPDRK